MGFQRTKVSRKMRTFLVVFCKLFREISHFFAKKYFSEMQNYFPENFAKMRKFFCEMRNYNCSNELVEFSCSDISMFKVLLCHINNFSSFTINVWWGEFDIGSRGYILPSNKAILRKLHKLCKPSVSFKAMCENLSSLAVLSSYHIFRKRKTLDQETPFLKTTSE